MTWRYQPVFTVTRGEHVYSVCEVYFDEHERLKQWTTNPSMHPQGETCEELMGDLTMMVDAVIRWEPVAFESLMVGMTFARKPKPDL